MADVSTQLTLLRVFSCFSAFFSGFVVLTGIVFPSAMLSLTKPFSHIIFFISFSDMMSSIGFTFGFPNNNTSLCTTQSILIFFFAIASWTWTLALVFQLNSIIVFQKLWVNLFTIHIVCWGISFLTLLLPLTTNSYGSTASGIITCSIQGNMNSIILWVEVILIWLPFSIFVLGLLLSLHMGWYISSHRYEGNNKQLSLLKASVCYPIALLLTWGPLIACNIIQSYFDVEISQSSYDSALIVVSQFGTFLFIIFISNSQRTRILWYKLFFKTFYKNKEQKEDISSDKQDNDQYYDDIDELMNNDENDTRRDTSPSLSFRETLSMISRISPIFIKSESSNNSNSIISSTVNKMIENEHDRSTGTENMSNQSNSIRQTRVTFVELT
eukprot:gene10195-13715_t